MFDGWGYTHMYKVDLTPGAKMKEIDIYAPAEGQSEAFAEGFGDMTVHEVATDPDARLVYVSHYALGMRVLKYDNSGLEEVGAFGRDAVDETPVERFGGRQAARQADHLDGAALAHQAWKPLRAGRAGDDAERGLGQAENRCGDGDAQVAEHRQLEPAAERHAVDGRDDRLR